MPKAYVDRMKRTVPRKIYDNRFGAPPVIRYYINPEDYIPDPEGRPWEQKILHKTLRQENEFQNRLFYNKFNHPKVSNIDKIPDDKWTIFPGDVVEVQVGKDKGKQGIVIRVLKETNSVFVDGLHTKLNEEMAQLEKYGLPKNVKWEEQRLDPSKGEVRLVDPHDKKPCEAAWMLNEKKTDWIRVSNRTGFEIPLPSNAKVTYDYISPGEYIEVEGKDTVAPDVLKRTFTPKLSLVEDEIAEEMGLKPDPRERKPTYWY